MQFCCLDLRQHKSVQNLTTCIPFCFVTVTSGVKRALLKPSIVFRGMKNIAVCRLLCAGQSRPANPTWTVRSTVTTNQSCGQTNNGHTPAYSIFCFTIGFASFLSLHFLSTTIGTWKYRDLRLRREKWPMIASRSIRKRAELQTAERQKQPRTT